MKKQLLAYTSTFTLKLKGNQKAPTASIRMNLLS